MASRAEPFAAPASLDPTAARARRRLTWLCALALLARLLFFALEPATQPTGDERTWVGWGTQSPAGVASPEVRFSPLRAGVLFYPPLYPYFIGAVWAACGTLGAVKLAQAALSVLLLPAVFRVAARLRGPTAGLWAAGIAAVYPDLIWFSVHFWSETLFLVLLWWAFERLLAADADAGPVTRDALAAGALWGLAILTRETPLYFTPLAALWLGARGARGARRGALFAFVALLTVAPWTLRNWVVYDAFVPVSTAGGLNLWQGNARLTRQEVYDRYQAVSGLVNQYRHARRMGARAIAERQPWWIFEKLRDELPLFLEADSLALVHARRGAYGEVGPAATRAAALVVLTPYLALLALFLVGCARLPLDRRAGLLLGFAVYYALLHVATHGFARYRLPIMPVVFVVAAAGLAAWRDPATPTRRRRLACAMLGLVLALGVAPSLRAWAREQAPVAPPAGEGGAP